MWQDCLARLCVAACVQFICEAFACASAAAAANRVSERSGKDNDELAGRQAGRQAAVRPGDADQVCVCWQRLGRIAQNPRLGRRYRQKKKVPVAHGVSFFFFLFFFFLW